MNWCSVSQGNKWKRGARVVEFARQDLTIVRSGEADQLVRRQLQKQ